MKNRCRKKSDIYKVTCGTIQKNKTEKANQERAEEVDLNKMIEKYGILPNEDVNKAAEPIYRDNRGLSMTVTERLKIQKETENYFKNLPANVRKAYNDDYRNIDNTLIMYEKGLLNEEETNKLLNYGIIRKEEQNEAPENNTNISDTNPNNNKTVN